MRRLVKFEVNGRAVEVDVEPRDTLLDVVRHRLGLTGAHAGCEHGACGACTLLVGGATVRSCLLLGAQCDGMSITTIEGVAAPGTAMSPTPEVGLLAQALMEAFRAHHAVQCGFCTPGMVLSAVELLTENHELDETTVRQGLAGNLCRCTGYAGIVAAVLNVARTRGHVETAPTTGHDGDLPREATPSSLLEPGSKAAGT